jgi:endonuclease/exonuclease/phosphatase (EEP) superfamily protein YafD
MIHRLKAARLLTHAACVIALVHPVALLGARHWWVFDLFTHFLEPAFLASLAAFFVSMRQKRQGAARGFFLLSIIQIATYFQNNHIMVGSPPIVPGSTLKILSANVFVDNADIGLLDRWISAQAPDLVILSEYTADWLKGPVRSRKEYPFKFESATGVDGLAVWSRALPIEAPRLEWPWPGGFPAIQARINIAGRRVTLWAVHPSSPIRRTGKGPGNPELAALSRAISLRDDSDSTLVIGDLNLTEGSPLWADLLRQTRLRDSRVGFGRQVTWPDWSPYRLPLDHVLISEDWVVLDRRVGPSLGSDHLPVLITLGLRSSRRPGQSSAQQALAPPARP